MKFYGCRGKGAETGLLGAEGCGGVLYVVIVVTFLCSIRASRLISSSASIHDSRKKRWLADLPYPDANCGPNAMDTPIPKTVLQCVVAFYVLTQSNNLTLMAWLLAMHLHEEERKWELSGERGGARGSAGERGGARGSAAQLFQRRRQGRW